MTVQRDQDTVAQERRDYESERAAEDRGARRGRVLSPEERAVMFLELRASGVLPPPGGFAAAAAWRHPANRYDMAHHAESAKLNHDARVGQGRLFDVRATK